MEKLAMMLYISMPLGILVSILGFIYGTNRELWLIIGLTVVLSLGLASAIITIWN